MFFANVWTTIPYFLFSDWITNFVSKSTEKSEKHLKKSLQEHNFLEMTKKSGRMLKQKIRFFKSVHDDYNLKVWKESVKSTQRNKALIFQPSLPCPDVERTIFSKSWRFESKAPISFITITLIENRSNIKYN